MLSNRKGMLGILVALSFLWLSACATTDTVEPSVTGSVPVMTPPGPVYYDFGDILIPRELQVDRKASFVHHSGGATAGLMVLRGKVEPKSLISFFENNMLKDNWRIQGSIKSSENMLLFRKEARWCMIHIKETFLNTHVQIWVLPSLDEKGTGLMR